MRIKIILIGILSLIVFYCKAQEKESFKIRANWKKGEVKEMTIQHSGSIKINSFEQSFPTTISAKFQISVLEKSQQGCIVEWKMINNSNDLDDNKIMSEYLEQYKYIIETDSNGNFKELSNWESLVLLNKNLKEQITIEAKKENVSQSEIDTILAQMNLAETKDEFVGMCNEITGIFHGCYGEEFIVNDTINKPTIISNEFIKEGIPATIEMTSKFINKNKVCIRYSYLYDYEKLKELNEKYFPDQEYSEVTINTFTEFEFNIKTTWIEKIIIYNEYKNSDSENITRIEYIIN